jgi:hypothetical protein
LYGSEVAKEARKLLRGWIQPQVAHLPTLPVAETPSRNANSEASLASDSLQPLVDKELHSHGGTWKNVDITNVEKPWYLKIRTLLDSNSKGGKTVDERLST